MTEASPAHGPAEPLVGATLESRYLITAHIASGGMASVFRGRDLESDRDVAVKVMRQDLVSSPDLVERFRREADILRRLDHPNVVRVTDLGRSRDGLVYLVMELLAGETLFDRLRRERTLPPDEIVPILVQVCAGLDAAHALGVVHRDLKPENVYLARDAAGETAKILDFGIAKFPVASDVAKTAIGVVVGTPEYLSPEQATGGVVDGRADLYSVGLIAWRALVGHHPFQGIDHKGLLAAQADAPVPLLRQGRPELDPWPALEAVVARSCAKLPARRPPSAAVLGSLLRGALDRPEQVPRDPNEPPTLEMTPLDAVPGNAPAGAARGGTGTARPRLAVGSAIVLGAIVAAVAVLVPSAPRQGAEARRMLDSGAPRAALDLADAALARNPEDPALLSLRARALLALPGRAGEGLELLARVDGGRPLDRDAHEALAASLTPGGSLSTLLAGADCDARRGAAHRLGDLGDPVARHALQALATARPPSRAARGDPCGAPEASEALRRLRER